MTKVLDHLERNGSLGRVVSAEHLDELRDEIRSLHKQGLLEESFYKEWMPSYVDRELAKSLRNPKSIFVIATPVPKLITTFYFDGKSYRYTVPPTYADSLRVTRHVKSLLVEGLRPRSYKLARAILPIKLLAVRSGLAQYGRNNITYIPKRGSFHRLTAFYSDFDSPEDHWQEKTLLAKCADCRACLKACPTGAISEDRILLHAERCLTRMNERSREHTFPAWVKPEWHNAIVGCMHCQRVCPYDKGIIEWMEERGSFSEDETAYLLKGKYSGAKAARMKKKLKSVGLDMSTFPRNLEALLHRKV